MLIREVDGEVNYNIFVDLDGVLADFEKGVIDLTGKPPSSWDPKALWPQLADTTIKFESPHHTILSVLNQQQELTDDLAGRLKALRQLARLELIDRSFTTITDKGRTVVKNLDQGEDFIEGPNFYGNLEPMLDGLDLWNYVEHLNPTILTGIPQGNWAPPQKKAWVAEHLGPNVPVITGLARDKQQHCVGNTCILIDDTEKNIREWRAAGGIGILHTDAQESIKQLEELGL